MRTKKVVVILTTILFASILAGCEGEAIENEKARLEQIENDVIKAIAEENYEYAKLLVIKMKWQYKGETAGAQSQCKDLKEYWEKKRREYLKTMGFNPDEILEKEEEKTVMDQIMGT